MTDISRLRVSLTKHGAHKVSVLLRKVDPKKLLDSTQGKVDGIKIDSAQATKNLSADERGLPAVWSEIRKLNKGQIDALVFLAIAFSHYELIGALSRSSTGNACGRLRRSSIQNSKAFTNFKNDIEELGLAVRTSAESVDYDLSRIFSDPQLASYSAKIFRLKLRDAGWSGTPSLEDECVALNFHKAVGLPEEFFRSWIRGAALLEPAGLEADDDSAPIPQPFQFTRRSTLRTTEAASRVAQEGPQRVNLLHNKLQRLLYGSLAQEFGMEAVSIEHPTGVEGTFIDAVLRDGASHIFFEIKTSRFCRACIRQALPQLLEYAYWRDDQPASKLVVVGPAKTTKAARKYLRLLRRKFRIPIYYRYISEQTGKLGKER